MQKEFSTRIARGSGSFGKRRGRMAASSALMLASLLMPIPASFALGATVTAPKPIVAPKAVPVIPQQQAKRPAAASSAKKPASGGLLQTLMQGLQSFAPLLSGLSSLFGGGSGGSSGGGSNQASGPATVNYQGKSYALDSQNRFTADDGSVRIYVPGIQSGKPYGSDVAAKLEGKPIASATFIDPLTGKPADLPQATVYDDTKFAFNKETGKLDPIVKVQLSDGTTGTYNTVTKRYTDTFGDPTDLRPVSGSSLSSPKASPSGDQPNVVPQYANTEGLTYSTTKEGGTVYRDKNGNIVATAKGDTTTYPDGVTVNAKTGITAYPDGREVDAKTGITTYPDGTTVGKDAVAYDYKGDVVPAGPQATDISTHKTDAPSNGVDIGLSDLRPVDKTFAPVPTRTDVVAPAGETLPLDTPSNSDRIPDLSNDFSSNAGSIDPGRNFIGNAETCTCPTASVLMAASGGCTCGGFTGASPSDIPGTTFVNPSAIGQTDGTNYFDPNTGGSINNPSIDLKTAIGDENAQYDLNNSFSSPETQINPGTDMTAPGSIVPTQMSFGGNEILPGSVSPAYPSGYPLGLPDNSLNGTVVPTEMSFGSDTTLPGSVSPTYLSFGSPSDTSNAFSPVSNANFLPANDISLYTANPASPLVTSGTSNFSSLNSFSFAPPATTIYTPPANSQVFNTVNTEIFNNTSASSPFTSNNFVTPSNPFQINFYSGDNSSSNSNPADIFSNTSPSSPFTSNNLVTPWVNPLNVDFLYKDTSTGGGSGGSSANTGTSGSTDNSFDFNAYNDYYNANGNDTGYNDSSSYNYDTSSNSSGGGSSYPDYNESEFTW